MSRRPAVPAADPRVDVRIQPRCVLALLVAAVLVAVLAWRLPDAFRAVDNRIAAGGARSGEERALAPAKATGVDPRILLRADAALPPRASYGVVTRPPGPGDLAALALPNLAAFWLLPRRQVSDIARADWVLAYGRDPSEIGLPYRRIVRLSPEAVVAQLR